MVPRTGERENGNIGTLRTQGHRGHLELARQGWHPAAQPGWHPGIPAAVTPSLGTSTRSTDATGASLGKASLCRALRAGRHWAAALEVAGPPQTPSQAGCDFGTAAATLCPAHEQPRRLMSQGKSSKYRALVR